MSQSQQAESPQDEPRRDSWAEAWQLAVELATAELAARDLAQVCERAGATWHAGRQVAEITFLGTTYEVAAPGFEIRVPDRADKVDIRERILLLHYLEKAGGRTATGEWIAFSEVPGAELYLGNFRARSADRIARAFGDEPSLLLEAGRALGGVEVKHGDAGVRFEALPHVPALALVWGGDEEFPASGDVLFDGCVVDYLSVEDIVVTAEKLATALCAR